MTTVEQLQQWEGRDVKGQDEDKIGTVANTYVDRSSGQPDWITVKTGLFGMKTSFVPIEACSEHGDHIHVTVTKDQIKDAPKVDDDGELSEEQERELYAHYGRDWGEFDYDRTYETAGRFDRGDEPGGPGGDTSGPNTDEAMTRSEEELAVGKTTRETGRARLRKYVVTEDVQTTVPVQREEVRVEREPITDANVDRATDGPAISEEEHEVTLHAEEPVVEKRTVPKERVRMETETVTEERKVDETVRKEQIEADGDTEPRR